MSGPIDPSLMRGGAAGTPRLALPGPPAQQQAELVDFCAPCNPYFPTPEMFYYLARELEGILKRQPSDADSVSAELGAIFGINPQTVALGNGSTELITWIDHLLIRQSMATPIPTFGRWTEQPMETGKRVDMFPLMERHDFALNLESFVRFVRQRGSRVVVICNPNSPDGGYIPRSQMIKLLDSLINLDLVVVDESYIDFVNAEPYTSLAEEAALRPNVVVLKSLGKSFGLHGIRFGYLVANPQLASAIRKVLPKWNLNAFAEIIISLLRKHQADYNKSLHLIARDRESLQQQLSELPGLNVYPSQGNFLLMKLPDGKDGVHLRNYLYNEHRVLVRECGNKLGITSQFVRVSVRPPDDIQRLLGGLTAFLYNTNLHRPFVDAGGAPVDQGQQLQQLEPGQPSEYAGQYPQPGQYPQQQPAYPQQQPAYPQQPPAYPQQQPAYPQQPPAYPQQQPAAAFAQQPTAFPQQPGQYAPPQQPGQYVPPQQPGQYAPPQQQPYIPQVSYGNGRPPGADPDMGYPTAGQLPGQEADPYAGRVPFPELSPEELSGPPSGPPSGRPSAGRPSERPGAPSKRGKGRGSSGGRSGSGRRRGQVPPSPRSPRPETTSFSAVGRGPEPEPQPEPYAGRVPFPELAPRELGGPLGRSLDGFDPAGFGRPPMQPGPFTGPGDPGGTETFGAVGFPGGPGPGGPGGGGIPGMPGIPNMTNGPGGPMLPGPGGPPNPGGPGGFGGAAPSAGSGGQGYGPFAGGPELGSGPLGQGPLGQGPLGPGPLGPPSNTDPGSQPMVGQYPEPEGDPFARRVPFPELAPRELDGSPAGYGRGEEQMPPDRPPGPSGSGRSGPGGQGDDDRRGGGRSRPSVPGTNEFPVIPYSGPELGPGRSGPDPGPRELEGTPVDFGRGRPSPGRSSRPRGSGGGSDRRGGGRSRPSVPGTNEFPVIPYPGNGEYNPYE